MVDTRDHAGDGLFFLIDVIYSHQSAGEGGDFAEGYEEGFVDLALGVDEDAAIEHYQAADTEEGGGEELDGEFHVLVVSRWSLVVRRCKDTTKKGGSQDLRQND